MICDDLPVGPDARLREVVSAVLLSTGLAAVPGAVAVRAPDGTHAVCACGPPEIDGPVTGATVMYGASLAKQVVGVLVSLAVEAGELNCDQPLSRFLPEFPPWADQVRVRHLLHHTSGLPGAVASLESSPTWDNALVTTQLERTDHLSAAPGTSYAYSNAGYICLAEIIGRVAGEPVTHLAAAALFTPLGMTSTVLGQRHGSARTGHQEPPTSVGDGGLWTTAEDLLRWNDGMNSRSLGPPVHDRAETPGTLDDGTPLDYAWGVRATRRGDRPTMTHGGSWPTWTAQTVRQPEQGISVAVVSAGDDAELVSRTVLLVADSLT